MSSSIWTPPAVASEARPCTLLLWRAVEAQHVVATLALVDSRAEQELLEALLEESKPPIAPQAAGLDYLLYTPFRYPPTHYGSRFRALTDPGVWYGAEAMRTSCAELGYWRWRFVSDSAGLERLDAVAHTVVQAQARGAAVDLRRDPFARDARAWQDPKDYGACQAFARAARSAGTRIVRYASVRDPQHGGCGAVLDVRAFGRSGRVRQRQSWFLSVDRQRAAWVRAGGPTEAFEFVFARS